MRDVSGIDGPRQARLTRTKNPLLKGFKVFAAAPFLSTTQADVEVSNIFSVRFVKYTKLSM